MMLRNKPVLCNYYLTYRCNAKCGFCDIWEKPSPYATIENVTQNIKDLKKMGVKVIDFTGGEPLLHQKLAQFLTIAKEHHLITTVTTNTLLYPKYAKQLKGLIDMLHFSLDSPIEEEHNLSRGVKCFDKVLESIEVAKSLDERPDILFTVDARSINQIEKVYQDFCVKNDLMLILNPIFEYNDVGSSLSEQDLIVLEKWGKKKNVYINKGFITLRRNGGNQIDKPVCKAATTTVVISPENKLILPCYHLSTQEIEIDNKLEELYEQDEIKKLIKLEGTLPACQGCVINCYMQPSFAVNLNQYWLDALPSTLKYNFEKGTWKKLSLFS